MRALTKEASNKTPSSRSAKMSNDVSPTVQRTPWHELHQTLGNQGVQRLLRTRAIQAKLRVSQPGDIHEQEADRIAEQVMRMPAPGERKEAPCAACADGGSTCSKCAARDAVVQRRVGDPGSDSAGASAPDNLLQALGPGRPLDSDTRAFFEPRFGQDFSRVRVHADARAVESARDVNALAYTVGRDVVFGAAQYAPGTSGGKKLLAHELAHVVQQGAARTGSRNYQADAGAAAGNRQPAMANHAPMLQRRAAPYIKKITVHLEPLQSADLEWEGTPPGDAPGSDHFTVSTGKGYGDPGDPPGTCTRNCCSDPMTQCAPPWNQPDKVGACCTYYGSNFWTGTPVAEHNTWKWWTPIQPWYSSRGIALHQHTEVTGHPIGHGCVRMEEPNAKRIFDYSNGRRTNVTTDGRAAPVACAEDRRCPGAGGAAPSPRGAVRETGSEDARFAVDSESAVPGLEGVMT